MPKGVKIEDKYPDECNELMSIYADPTNRMSLTKLCKEFNLGYPAVKRMIDRNNIKFQDIQVKSVQTWEDLVPKLTEMANIAFDQSLATMHELNAYQAALVGAIAIDKKHAIEAGGSININVLHDHRHELGDIGQELMQELRNRKLITSSSDDYIDMEEKTVGIDDAKAYVDQNEKGD